MTIEWYPGHMTKARRQITETIQGFNVIIEVLDARLPAASANPVLTTLRGNKPCIKVLNKNDLADPVITKAWVKFFEQEKGVKALPLEARQRLEAGQVTKLCRQLAPTRGKPGYPLRVMVIGIPNVGKSTLINTLAGRRMARVGDKPAITTCPQQIDLRNGIFLSDTPGLLWPEMRDQNRAYRLATSGAIGDSAIAYADVGLFAANFMLQRYPERLGERYSFEQLPESPLLLLEEIGRRRGGLVAGGEVDLNRAGEVLLRDLRGGKLGRISLEQPGEDLALPGEDEEGGNADESDGF